MPLRMWTLDFAREQAPTVDHLFRYAAQSLDAGYDTLGLYVEHAFDFPSVPWVSGKGSLNRDGITKLRTEFPSLKVVPFMNLLGHMEGFLNTEEGSRFRETPYRGMQGCPSNPEFVRFCEGLVDDTLSAFESELIHIGGDETWELGRCPKCSQRPGGAMALYAEHFGPLAERLVRQGRRPGVWGDIFLEHPEALAAMPAETLVFDWQYFGGLKDSSPKLSAHGHEVVGCPSLRSYDAAWFHLTDSETNVRAVSKDARDMGLAGVCLTTWECGLFGAYDTLLPFVAASRAIMDDPELAPSFLESCPDREWTRLLGVELNALGGVFGPDGHRHRLKSRLLLYGNPFLAWMHHREELSGETGVRALELCERALAATTDEARKGVAFFVRGAVEFVRMAEAAHRWYAQDEPEKAVRALSPMRHLFDTLETVARRSEDRIGGSIADAERCRIAKRHVETVIRRVQSFGRRELGYLPAFDVITHPHFVPHDQTCWWGVNKWGDE